MTPIEKESRRGMRRLNAVGLALVLLLVCGAGGWAAKARISGAVVAQGDLVVETKTKEVQHPAGGIVGAVLVEDGDLVDEGQVLVRLDDTLTRAKLGVVSSQIDELEARRARLRAERDHAAAVVFPAALTRRLDSPAVGEAVAGERTLFRARRSSLARQAGQLGQRLEQTREEIAGLTAQIAAKRSEIELTAEELEGVDKLYAKSLVGIARLKQLQRDKAHLEGELGNPVAAKGRAGARSARRSCARSR